MIYELCTKCKNDCKEMTKDNPAEKLMWKNGKCPEFEVE